MANEVSRPDQNGYEAYRSLVLRYGSRDAHGENNPLIKVMYFNFGDIDIMESKFEEFNLMIKDHDDISGTRNVPDTIKRAILVAPEPLRTHLQQPVLQTCPRDAPGNQRQLKARNGFKLEEREDDPVDGDLVHKKSPKSKGKGEDKSKGKPKGKDKGKRKGKHNDKEMSAGKGKSCQETF